MITPVSNIPHRMQTPHTATTPSAWNTPEFHTDCAIVTLYMQEIRNEGTDRTGCVERFMAFLAGPSGNRVLTYDRISHETVKQFFCELWADRYNLNIATRGNLSVVCGNQGWQI